MSYPEFGNRRMSAASIAAEVEGVGGQFVSAQTIRRTLHQIGLHGCRPRRKPLLKMMHKKARKQFAEDKQTMTWITGTMSCGQNIYCMCVYLYIHNKYTQHTHILCKQKALVYIYIYIYIYTHTHTHIQRKQVDRIEKEYRMLVLEFFFFKKNKQLENE